MVEAQADLDKKGDYALILLVGGEEAISDDDKLKIIFHVGANPYAWLEEKKMLIIGGVVTFLTLLFSGIYFRAKNKHSE